MKPPERTRRPSRKLARRRVLEGAFTLAQASALSLPAAGAPSPRKRPGVQRPNVVLVMADDMGFSDLGCYGGEIATPSLDTLAAGGLRFSRFYNAARCCPTRASLLTGLYPHQAGVGHMVKDLGRPAYVGRLNDRCLTLAEALRQDEAYRTLMVGKWHVGEDPEHWPRRRGFDRYFGLISGASSYFRLDPGRRMVLDDDAYTPPDDGHYMTDAFTEHALGLLDEHGRGPRPFFLYLAYTAPHWPLHAWPEDIARYQGRYTRGWDELRRERHQRLIALGLMDPGTPLTPRDARVPAWVDVPAPQREAWSRKMSVYAAQVDRMDRGIGRIKAKIDELGAGDRTLFLFLSDNGGSHETIDRGKVGAPIGSPESYTSYGLPWANASNTPFRLFKTKIHEGGISTPFVAHWPGVIAPGSLTHQPAHVVDVMATLLDVAGLPYPRRYGERALVPLEGRSLVPLFRGRPRAGQRVLCWEHEGNRAVSTGRYKLVAQHGHPWELYDVEHDRAELHDLAPRLPGRVRELDRLYQAWAARCGVVPWDEARRA